MIYLAAVMWLASTGQSRSAQNAPGAAAFDLLAKQAAQAREESRIPDAVKLYQQAIRLRPSWKEGWWYLGALHYEQDSYVEGRDALRHLIALDPKSGPGYAMLGLCEYETREYDRALAHINEGRRLGLGPDRQVRRVVLHHAVLLLTLARQYESALQVVDKLVKEGPPPPELIRAAGLAGLRKPILPHDLPEADRELVETAGRAVCAVSARNTAEARKEFGVLLATWPNVPNVHYLYGTFLLGSDPDGALREFEKELAANPKHVEALVTIALEYEKRGDSEQAIRYAQRGVEADPQFFAAHGVLGRLLANSGEVKKGIQELELARQQAPDSPQVHFSLAAAYVLAGRKDEAGRERAEFLRLKQLADETK